MRGDDAELDVLAESLVRAGVLSAEDAVAAFVGPETSVATRRLWHDEATALHTALRGSFESMAGGHDPTAVQIEALNSALARRLGHVQFVQVHDCLELTPSAPEAVSRAITQIALIAAHVLTDAEAISRLRRCRDAQCGRLFIDHTRNRSGRWCEMRACGNRAKARRFYARRRASLTRIEDAAQADGVP